MPIVRLLPLCPMSPHPQPKSHNERSHRNTVPTEHHPRRPPCHATWAAKVPKPPRGHTLQVTHGIIACSRCFMTAANFGCQKYQPSALVTLQPAPRANDGMTKRETGPTLRHLFRRDGATTRSSRMDGFVRLHALQKWVRRTNHGGDMEQPSSSVTA